MGFEQSSPYRFVLSTIFGRVETEPDWGADLSAAASRGCLVHLMRSGTVLDTLCLDAMSKREGLPTIAAVHNDSDPLLTRTFLGHQLIAASQHPERALQHAVLGGSAALLYLRRNDHAPVQRDRGDPVLALIDAQRQSARPILLVPQTLVWGKLPSHQRHTWGDLLFGPAESPGHLRALAQLALNPRDALLRAGPPFDLQEFLKAHAHLTDRAAADKVRYAMLRRIERERTVVLGPRTKSPQRLRDEILRSPRLRPHLESAARASQRPLAEVQAQAGKDLERLIAAPSATLLGVMNRALDTVWNRLYDGLVVDEAGMTRIRDASRQGTLVLFPSHKSHIDYVVLSDVFYAHGLSTPLVAAGDNLNFWPLGPTLRHAGAFFIHRALAGQKLYSALLSAYVRRLLLEGFTLEVFLEGGRSRTGKLLTPKLGVLSMIVDAALATHGHPIYFVPISIAYERVIEERAFMQELAGSEKQAEDITGLLQTPKVFRSRYGRLFLDVGEILSFDALLNEVRAGQRAGAESALTPKARRTLIHNIAMRTAREINRVTVVTPSALTATALLSHRRRGLTKATIVQLARWLVQCLTLRGARVADTLAEPMHLRLVAAVSEALDLFVDAKLVARTRTGVDQVYRVPSIHRLAVEYYRNTILHFFAPTALLSCVLMAQRGMPITRENLLERSRVLRERLAHELPIGDPTHADMVRALEQMIVAEDIEPAGDTLITATGEHSQHVESFAWMLRGSIESHRIALRAARALTATPVPLKTWLRDALSLGERMYLAGELEAREAISRDRLENALHALHDAGIVRLQSEQSVAAGKEHSAGRLDEEDRVMGSFAP